MLNSWLIHLSAYNIILIFNGVTCETYDLDIRMPSVVSEAPDTLMCTARKLNPEEAYIVQYTPHASKETAHHMMVYGCLVPDNRNQSWICDRSDSRGGSGRSVCGNEQEREILFAWALNAPAKNLPEGVGFRISGSTKAKYIVVQLHYSRKFEEGERDNSGITLRITHQRPPQQMGYYVLASMGSVEPQLKEAHVETACVYQGEYPMYPIGYRTHAHNLGVVTAGYRIRDGEWMEIGRMSPQLPETFYNISHPGMDIQKGDILASRCTMNSMSRTEVTFMGPTNHDEMCNFYIMYSTDNQDNLSTKLCIPPDTEFKWDDVLTDYLPYPADASSLSGIAGADFVRKKFNMALTSTPK